MVYINSNQDIDTRTLNGVLFGFYLSNAIEWNLIKLKVIFEVEITILSPILYVLIIKT